MKLQLLASSFLLSQASAWSIYLTTDGCVGADHDIQVIEDKKNNNVECMALPSNLTDYLAFSFGRNIGRCQFSLSTSADNCANKVYTNTYDANNWNGCFHIKYEWQYLTVAECTQNDGPPV